MSLAITNPKFPTAERAAPIRVMVVDDSVVARGLIKRWLVTEPDLEVVASLRTGRQAVDQLENVNPDVVVLDVEMPDLDGISALPLLLQKKRNLAIIMASTLTRRNAEVTLKALSLGALDCIAKPEANTVNDSAAFQRGLIAKIREFGLHARRPVMRPRKFGSPLNLSASRPPLAPSSQAPLDPPLIALRPFARSIPRVLVIGASTGGPQALNSLLSQLASTPDQVPILITQHMPPTFTTILAEHLGRASGRPASEAEHGETILPGHIYVAPGGKHMRVARRDNAVVIALDDGAPVHFCKPAVDPLFASAAEIWGSGVLSVILTGMGTDGTLGAANIVAAGGSVIAQNDATSVVWGMPGSVTDAGLCSAVLPLDEIAQKIIQLFAGERP